MSETKTSSDAHSARRELGDDETHYERRWIDKDLNDLKNLIRLTVNWIANEEIGQAVLHGHAPGIVSNDAGGLRPQRRMPATTPAASLWLRAAQPASSYKVSCWPPLPNRFPGSRQQAAPGLVRSTSPFKVRSTRPSVFAAMTGAWCVASAKWPASSMMIRRFLGAETC